MRVDGQSAALVQRGEPRSRILAACCTTWRKNYTVNYQAIGLTTEIYTTSHGEPLSIAVRFDIAFAIR